MASIISKMAAGVAKVKKAVQNKFDALANYKVGSAEVALPIDLEQETVWATQEQMAELFGVSKKTVSEHLVNLFKTSEIDEDSVVRKFQTTASDGKSYNVKHYSLDAILAVGFKVNGSKAIAFRKWASTVLKGYIQDGYALNGKRLNSDPATLLNLAREVRAIRTSEMNLYTQVRETFAQCSIDYDKDDPAARKFFADSQNVFHFAASELTASQILLSRADATKPNMGLVGLGNKRPTAKDVTVAKNYCTSEELRKMELIGESWLLYAEGMAMQGKQVSMQRLLDKLTDLVEMHEFPVFPGYKGIPQKATADAHAKAQYELFKTASTKQIA
ncbi:RhuM family protein [Agrobacterium pusense]|uniref:RhuM family protein n=1 Tax=Agrobacterium pusense TaxID=648995 RepID=UPI0028A642DA|nr:RhuM family protein [Agrobacterium pusense]